MTIFETNDDKCNNACVYTYIFVCVTRKTIENYKKGPRSHFSDTTSSTEQNLRFTKLAQDFCSLIIIRV